MSTSVSRPFAERVRVFPGDGLTVVVLPTQTKNAVWISGAFPGGSIHERFNPSMAASLLDKGTIHHTKDQLHDRLEDLGTTMSFDSNFSLFTWGATCLTHDVPAIADLAVEMIQEPAFPESEYALEKSHWISGYKRAKDDTAQQANIALSQLLFPEGHPQYVFSHDERIRRIEQQTLDEVKGFFQKCGRGEMYIVVAGDVEPDSAAEFWHQRFGSWRKGTWSRTPTSMASLPTAPGRSRVISIADKTSVDVRGGVALGIDINHPDMIPLAVARFVLGGDFNSRLTQTVREKKGLTYGIGSAIRGPAFGEMTLIIHATFAPQLLKSGVSATREVMQIFFDEGITAKELEESKKTLIGQDVVGMATTRGLVGEIESLFTNVRPFSYVDEWPLKIEAVTLEDVHRVIKQYLGPTLFAWTYAGSISERETPCS